MTVVSHRLAASSTSQKKFNNNDNNSRNVNIRYKLRDVLRRKEIQNQNKRLFKAIKMVSSEVIRSTSYDDGSRMVSTNISSRNGKFAKFNKIR